MIYSIYGPPVVHKVISAPSQRSDYLLVGVSSTPTYAGSLSGRMWVGRAGSSLG